MCLIRSCRLAIRRIQNKHAKSTALHRVLPLEWLLDIWYFPLNWPTQAIKQFFHCQCWKSVLLIHPGNSLTVFIPIICLTSSLVNYRRYSFETLDAILLANAFTNSSIESFNICQFSSIASTATLCANILIAATTRWIGLIRRTKIMLLLTAEKIQSSTDRGILNRRSNEVLLYFSPRTNYSFIERW